MKRLYLKNGKEAGVVDVIRWWLENYDGMEHLTENNAVA